MLALFSFLVNMVIASAKIEDIFLETESVLDRGQGNSPDDLWVKPGDATGESVEAGIEGDVMEEKNEKLR